MQYDLPEGFFSIDSILVGTDITRTDHLVIDGATVLIFVAAVLNAERAPEIHTRLSEAQFEC